MTPIQAQDELEAAIKRSPKVIASLRFISGPNIQWPIGGDTAIEVMALAEKVPKQTKQNLWTANSEKLLMVSQNWADRFTKVAKKLQEGERFAPEEITGTLTDNTLDPALHNVLADGWHHNPITQPLDTI